MLRSRQKMAWCTSERHPGSHVISSALRGKGAPPTCVGAFSITICRVNSIRVPSGFQWVHVALTN
eukprot:9451158-Alexandrium_andersonii.AAC.1